MNLSRRNFLAASSGAAVAGLGLFNIGCTGPSVCRPRPSGRINVAVIGCGTMGCGNMNEIMKDKRVQIVCTCDPVEDALAYGYDPDWKKKWRGGRKPFKEMVDKFYGGNVCRAVADWREVVADPSIDAVMIETTDHWHAIIAIAAMKAGKHVFCQKPLTMSIAEGRRMCEVAEKTGVAFQTGSQQRSSAEHPVGNFHCNRPVR